MTSKSSASNSGVRLSVIGGRHAGAVRDANGERQTIGSSLDADLVLTDAGVCPRHARIDLFRWGFELEALEGVVVVNDNSMQPGEKREARYPASVAVGDAKIEIVKDGAAQGRMTASFLSLGALGLLALVTLENGLPGPAKNALLAEPATKIGGSTKVFSFRRAALDGAETKVAADALRQYLFAQGIDTINVEAGAGTVISNGSIVPERQGEWQSAEMWFDEKFGQEILLKSDVSISSAKPVKAPITIQSVWLGEMPYLIDGDGRKYFEGSVLKGGWVLEKVEMNKILMSKDKQPLILRY